MPILVHCKTCNNEFKSNPSSLKKNKSGHHYCSRDCYYQDAKNISPRGEDHYGYIKDVPPFPIDDEITAYFLGFMQTDGTIQKKFVSIEINDIDASILYLFQLKFGGRVSFRTRDTNFKKDTRLVQWRLGSVSFVRQMNALGLHCGKKSFTTKPLPIPQDLIRHYVRGIIDGDGSLIMSGMNIPMIGFTTGSSHMAEFYSGWLASHGIPTLVRPNARDNVYNIAVTREKAQTIAKELYLNHSIALPRKADKAKEIMAWQRPEKMIKHDWTANRWTDAELSICAALNYDYRKIQPNYLPGRTKQGIRIRCQKERRANGLPPVRSTEHKV